MSTHIQMIGQKKLLKGSSTESLRTQMAGCREKDQKIRHQMVAKMNGVNLAEHFNKKDKLACD